MSPALTVIALAGTAFSVLLAISGTLPNEYLIRVRGMTGPQPYPFVAICVEILLIAAVFGALAWASTARAWSRIRRLALGASAALVIGAYAGIGAMHASPHFVYFALGMFATGVQGVLATLALSIKAIVDKLRN